MKVILINKCEYNKFIYNKFFFPNKLQIFAEFVEKVRMSVFLSSEVFPWSILSKCLLTEYLRPS